MVNIKTYYSNSNYTNVKKILGIDKPRYDVRFRNQISCILTSVSFKDPYRTFYVNIISDDEQKHERSIMSSW